jgi:hypothetical protein
MVSIGQLKYNVLDARKTSLAQGEAKVVSSFGSFDFVFKLPDTVNMGAASINLTVENLTKCTHTHKFNIQVFIYSVSGY